MVDWARQTLPEITKQVVFVCTPDRVFDGQGTELKVTSLTPHTIGFQIHQGSPQVAVVDAALNIKMGDLIGVPNQEI